ncbi:F-box protein At5g07610-like [Daucus carota subsp. sativus]|uniref:F-box protein At5g07610-like n=1 Tax=Daucus carota subsp. sativus TaxID=79200 RepID=UPI00308296A9
MSLAFDPARSPYYKVVCVRQSKTSDNPFQIEIYSYETRLWRVSGQPFKAPQFTKFENCIYWNGCVHWWNGFVSLWNDEQYTLYFKVEEERVEQLPMTRKNIQAVVMPDQDLPEQVATYLGESQGHWHLIDVYSDSTCLFNVYEMARDYSGWFVKYHVDLSAISTIYTDTITNGSYDYRFNILSLVRRGQEEEEDGSFLVLEIPGGKIVRYNFADKSVVKLCEFDPIVHRYYYNNDLKYISTFSYMESFASV